MEGNDGLENISTYECSVEELPDWPEIYVRPRAKLAFEGKSQRITTPKRYTP
ncbi:DUF2800 domain-containing protein [Clostridium sp. OF13-4]|uniref:DUF2800 domain-containing protein n=1 Tax=uncultured Clostridium sp. TaxID=59620 RepID=UPI000E5048B7|nr:DUF2800 domain-containing protein [Clostridium sp. AF12-41]RHO90281.1 DUF2800 domain-containing protein [Clostridium sp. AF37-7]RHS73881.1 DUF2800 domain-containing protein [Clostridium sp. AM43-3BH]RHV74556.1 DUF2800 domain-containing protein [Clostridium sp. OF13-4]